jgi:hypothetical protein
MNKSKTRENPTVEWNQINWRKAERLTFKLQKRIYRASERGDVKAVRKLQKTLINSWSNKVLAVRRVTQDNTSQRTSGVDGIKLLNPKQRIKLVQQAEVKYLFYGRLGLTEINCTPNRHKEREDGTISSKIINPK